MSYRKNELCAYWLHCLNEQLAIRAGKLRILPGAEARDPDLKQYPISHLHAARLVFRAIGIDFKATGKSTGRRFCEMLGSMLRGCMVTVSL